MNPSPKSPMVTAPSPESATMGVIQTSRWDSPSNSRAATPLDVKPALNEDTELASAFKSDLTDIRNLVTCSICDQLLYEPWTLSCGHTYCYSCLCNWFVPNKRKKTCPECRTSIKQMPAPAFLVKQMVEICCKQSEIMPSDESVDQHNKKRAEEMADVDKDKSSPEGLFKGTFRIIPLTELLYDEADGVLRCPHCQYEHEGGPQCVICGAMFEEPHDDDDSYAFSDFDDDIDGDLELEDLEVDVDEQYHPGHLNHFLGQIPHIHHFLGPGQHHAHFHRVHHHHYNESLGESSGNDSSEGSEGDEEDDNEGSLHDFVVRDEEPNRNQRLVNGRNNHQPINISDDESDEGGPVNPRRRQQNRRQIAPSSSPLAPSLVSITDSENGQTNADAEMLRDAGWSPLDTENETDDEEPIRHAYHGYGTTEDEQNSDDESDSNTMRNEASDDEDDHSRDDVSETPTYVYDGNRYIRDYTPNSCDDGDDHSQADYPHSMDGDGDTEMSASPGPSNSGRSGNGSVLSGYGYNVDGEVDSEGEGTPRGHREISISTDGYGDMGENLGLANQIHNIEDDSSDTSIQPPARRRRPRQIRSARVHQTDPRISMMFAEHQLSLRGALNDQGGLDQFDIEPRGTEPGSRNLRLTSYRLQPPRRVELRSSRSPSATRLISSSNRVARPPRQYQRRYH